MTRGEKLRRHDLKTMVSGGNLFYTVNVQDRVYSFPIPVEDAKGTTLFAEFKAITLMRWTRKAIESKFFQPVKS